MCIRLGMRHFCQHKLDGKSKEQNAGIIRANLSKMYLVSYNSHAQNKIQYRMVKNRQPLLNDCFMLSLGLKKIDIL